MTSLWKMAQITSKLKAVGQCGATRGHCPSAALLRRARDSTQLGESESRSDIPSSWDNDPGLWAQCQYALAGCQALPAPPHTSCQWNLKSGTIRDHGQRLGIRGQLLDWPRQGPVPGPCHITGRWMNSQWQVASRVSYSWSRDRSSHGRLPVHKTEGHGILLARVRGPIPGLAASVSVRFGALICTRPG